MDWMRRRLGLVIALVMGLALVGLYWATAATGIVPGDPTEYTFVAHVLGIAHPPGYAFMTLVTKVWQTLVPLGTVAQRSHWLAGVAGALTGVLVFGAVWQIGAKRGRVPTVAGAVPALLGGLSVAMAADHWQHSIHINSHIVTVTLNAAAILLLLRWWRTEKDGWLYGFCVVAGLGPTHHPLTVFSWPAFALFILAVRPGLIQVWSRAWWRERRWRILFGMALSALAGLSVWLYYPIRSPMEPVFGPADMNTLDGFLNVALARGLRVNLFHFGPAEQGQRALVFWTLLRQQFVLPVLALALLGAGWLAWWRRWRPLLLLGLVLLVNLAFVINTVQDVMAYLLTPFMVVGLLAGVGGLALMELARRAREGRGGLRPVELTALSMALLVWPLLGLVQQLPRISLRGYEAGDRYIEAVEGRFTGRGEGATLLNDWEHMTPLWYRRYVDGRWSAPEDVVPSLVSPDRPWLERVFEHLPGGPVYLSDYRREVVDAGFRLWPDGPFYRVVEPGDTTMPDGMVPVPAAPGGGIELLGYRLAERQVPAGGLVALDLAMRTTISLTDYLVPYVTLGAIDYAFTTDSHLLTPWWRPGEVIVERFEMALPLDQPAGGLPLSVGIANLSTGTRSEAASLGELAVTEKAVGRLGRPEGAALDRLLANFGQRVGVDRVSVRGGGQRRTAVWQEPVVLTPGDALDVVIVWRCLAPIEESYTVFVHLMDAANRVWDQTDYTPLGGSYPTHLWIPKWLPGQTALDPYRLTVPPGAPPGDYYVEIGLYAMTSRQRIYQYDRDGDLVGDRLVLGPIRITEPLRD